MRVTRHFARRVRLLGLLRTSLAVGAVIDLATAVALAVAPAALPRAISGAGGLCRWPTAAIEATLGLVHAATWVPLRA